MTKRRYDRILYVAAGFAVLAFPALLFHFPEDTFYGLIARLACLIGICGCVFLTTIWFCVRPSNEKPFY